MIYRILTPSDIDFKLFFDILEESQGGLLHRFSNTTSKIVSYLIYKDIEHPELFQLESVDSKEIMEYAKGLLGFLRMLK